MPETKAQPAKQTAVPEHPVFALVSKGDYTELEKLLARDQTIVNLRNAQGYTPLHWLTIHYVDYRPDILDLQAARKNTELTEAYFSCMKLLVKNGASLYLLTPEYLNAVQFAVYKGKLDVFNYLKNFFKNYKSLRDGNGNTLLHLLADADLSNKRDRFEQQMVENILCDDVNLYTPNHEGQIPLIYLLSKPRCPGSKNCSLGDLLELLSLYENLSATRVKDKYGMTAMDYAKKYNPWAVSHLENFIATATVREKNQREFQQKFEQQVQEYQRKVKEWETKNAASGGGGCQNCTIGESFTIEFEDECYVSNQQARKSGKGARATVKFYNSRIEIFSGNQHRTCYAKASRLHPDGTYEYILDEGCGYRWAGYKSSEGVLMLESPVGTRTFLCK
ncbi:MAG: ankyrin repeat domain-containing protein [Chitinophagaceae bacterium]|nr:ankyrin repeat domain-containing protein [Chitinophagaceae bacterium]